MRIIAYINWVFFLIVFSALGFFYRGIAGLDKSYENNYFSEELKLEEEEVYYFPKSTMILGTILDSKVEVENFPFNLFTHIIVDENVHIDTFYDYHRALIRNKEKLDLDNKELLLNIQLADALDEYSEDSLFVEAYRILDSLALYFPDSPLGLVFELDASQSQTEIANALSMLSQKIPANYDHKNYLCLNYSKAVKQYKIDFLKNKALLPKNYSGQFIKTFDSRSSNPEIQLSSFDRIGELISLFKQNSGIDIKKTVFCFPTYPLILKRGKNSNVLSLDAVAEDLQQLKEEEGNKTTGKIGQANVTYFKNIKKVDSIYYYITEQKTDTTDTGDTITRTVKLERLRRENMTYAFEDQGTLESKIKFAIQEKINVGFWNTLSILHQDKPVSKSQNPMDVLLKFAKGNFIKKVQKKPGDMKEIVINPVFHKGENDQFDWTEPDAWYWQTLEKHILRPKTPDYLLFLLMPLMVMKILLPAFILLYFTLVNSYSGDLYLKPMRVNLFNALVPVYRFLGLDVFFWCMLIVLFMLNWHSADGNTGYTTRSFSILILLIAILGRPIVKFLIKLLKLAGKPFKFKKVIKLLPHLGEMIYYNITKEERENSVKLIIGRDRDRNVYGEGKTIKGDDADEGNKKDLEYERFKDYFSGNDYREIDDNQEEAVDTTREVVDKEGKGIMKIPAWFVLLFKSLFLITSIGLVWYFEFAKFGGFDWDNISIYYVGVMAIFVLEIFIIASYFFKEYYIYYLTKLFARNA
jgi:hypothetical protein